MIVLAPNFMTKICKKAGLHFHCAVSKVFDRVKSVAPWSENIRKLVKDHKGYGSTANVKVDILLTCGKHFNEIIDNLDKTLV